MEKKERSKKPKKAKRLIVVAGALILLALGSTGCTAKQTAAPAQMVVTETTADPDEKFKVDIPLELEDPTKEVIETIEGGGEIGKTATGETVYSMGKYGDLGKEAFDNLASSWTKWIIKDEAELREIMDITYGNLSTKEELTQEILALPRESQTQSTESTKATTSPKSNGGQETKPATTTPTKPSTTQTTQAPQATAPANNNGGNQGQNTAPGLTPEQQEEVRRLKEEDKAKQTAPDNRGVDTGQGQDFDSSAGKWDWN